VFATTANGLGQNSDKIVGFLSIVNSRLGLVGSSIDRGAAKG
jgi:hypothetical protein